MYYFVLFCIVLRLWPNSGDKSHNFYCPLLRNVVRQSPAAIRAWAIPALTVGGAVVACNVVNSFHDTPANGISKLSCLLPACRIDEPMCAALYYPLRFGLQFVMADWKAALHGAVWPLTLWHAQYMYRCDGHVKSTVFPHYSSTDMYKEEERKRTESTVSAKNSSEQVSDGVSE